MDIAPYEYDPEQDSVEDDLTKVHMVVTKINHSGKFIGGRRTFTRDKREDGTPILPVLYELVGGKVLINRTITKGIVYVAGYPTGNTEVDILGDTYEEVRNVPFEKNEREYITSILVNEGIEGKFAFE